MGLIFFWYLWQTCTDKGADVYCSIQDEDVLIILNTAAEFNLENIKPGVWLADGELLSPH